MALEISERVNSSSKSLIRYMNKFVRENTIHLGIGQISFNPPKELIESGKKAFEDKLYYTPNKGLPELRNLVISEQNKKDGRNLSQENVIITNGAEEALSSVFASLIDKGDEILIPEIYFGVYEKLPKFFGGDVKYFKLLNDFGIDYEDLKNKISAKTKLIVLNSPANPTGRVLNSEELSKLSEIIKGSGIYVISDEVYSELYFKEKPETFSKFYEDTIIVNGISKRSAATGLRIGWVISPTEEISDAINQSHTLMTSCASIISQKAVIPVLENKCFEEENNYRNLLKENQDLCLETFKNLNIPLVIPDGAFYLFIDISQFEKNSLEFAEEIASSDTNVITVPGIAFGKAGDNYLRVSYAVEKEKLIEGLKRLENFFKNK